MRSVQRDKHNALACFSDTYDIRRAIFAVHQRKLREAREERSARTRTRDTVVVSSSVAELMTSSTPECDSLRYLEVYRG